MSFLTFLSSTMLYFPFFCLFFSQEGEGRSIGLEWFIPSESIKTCNRYSLWQFPFWIIAMYNW